MPFEQDDEIPWEQRDGWRDITPLPQDDPPHALCQIAYHPAYRNAMDAYRYLVSIGEKSARGVELTEAIVRQNPSHYSVWAFRFECLIRSQADLAKELDLMDELIKLHLKSYQVWHHRRTVVTALNDPSRELDFTSRALAEDSKNYHTWCHRQWVLCHFWGSDNSRRREAAQAIWQGEVSFVDGMLATDVRNNSAWNHRFFVVFESGSELGSIQDLAAREVRYTQEKLGIAPNNASAWNYLRGVLQHVKRPLTDCLDFARPIAARNPPAYLAIEFVADALASSRDLEKRREAALVSLSAQRRVYQPQSWKKLYEELAMKWDPIRAAFYRMNKEEALE